MKRLLSLFMCLVLLILFIPSHGEESGAVITIDGIRTAFFSSDGAYLPPLEKGGLVWVPAVSLGESLGREITANPETLVVTLDGIRIAFFGPDNSFLTPLLQDGTVYIPLVAFAESAGLGITVSDRHYAVSRSSHSSDTVSESITVEMFAQVPLTLGNYQDYYGFSQQYYIDGKNIVYQLEIIPLTGFEPVNIQFILENYGTVIVPANENGSAAYRGPEYINNPQTKEEVGQNLNTEGTAILTVSEMPSVLGVSGFIRMSKTEADQAKEKMYNDALSWAEYEKDLTALAAAADTLEKLAAVDYRDCAERFPAVRDKYLELLSAEEQARNDALEAERAAEYSGAVTAMENGDYAGAAEVFQKLASFRYRDSREKLEEIAQIEAGLEEERKNARYQEAEAALSEKDFDTAKSIFSELKAENYRDSSERYQQLLEDEKSFLYQKAMTAYAEGEYEEAQATFSSLDNYMDSGIQALKCEVAILMKQGEWNKALELLEKRKDQEAVRPLYQELLFRTASDVSAPDENGTVWFEARNSKTGGSGTFFLMAKDGTILLEGLSSAEMSYYNRKGEEKTASRYSQQSDSSKMDRLNYYQDYALQFVHGKAIALDRQGNETFLPDNIDYRQYAGENLFCCMDKKTSLYGCTDISGIMIIKPSYALPFRFRYGLAVVMKKDKKGYKYGVINSKGKVIVKIGAWNYCSVLDENLIACTKVIQKDVRKVTFLDANGKQIQNAPDCNLAERENDYIIYRVESGQCGIMDMNLNILLEPSFSVIQNVISDQLLIGIPRTDQKLTWLGDNFQEEGINRRVFFGSGLNLCRYDGTPVIPEGKYADMFGSSASPCIAAKSRETGWCLLDLDGNLIY